MSKKEKEIDTIARAVLNHELENQEVNKLAIFGLTLYLCSIVALYNYLSKKVAEKFM